MEAAEHNPNIHLSPALASSRAPCDTGVMGKRQSYIQQVEAWRKEMNLSQEVLATLIGTTQRRYSHWITRGEFPEAVLYFIRLADLMGVTPQEMSQRKMGDEWRSLVKQKPGKLAAALRENLSPTQAERAIAQIRLVFGRGSTGI